MTEVTLHDLNPEEEHLIYEAEVTAFGSEIAGELKVGSDAIKDEVQSRAKEIAMSAENDCRIACLAIWAATALLISGLAGVTIHRMYKDIQVQRMAEAGCSQIALDDKEGMTIWQCPPLAAE